jgi:outer membrane protein assembly factor BamD (BamD/ComL family)
LGNAAFAICALLFIAGAAVTTAIGCAWSFLNEHSVRFSGYASPGEFTRLPPLPINPVARRGNASGSRHHSEDTKYEAEERREKEMNELWAQAGEAEEKGDFARTGRLLREYLQRSSAIENDGVFDTQDWQARRNSAVDRLDAMTALSQGIKPDVLSAYLNARRAFDQAASGISKEQASNLTRVPSLTGVPGFTEITGLTRVPDALSGEKPTNTQTPDVTGLLETLESLPQRQALADNIAYLRAAILYRQEKMGEAARAFSELAARYPRSEKREAALYMNGVALLRLHCPPGGDETQKDGGCEEAPVVREAFRRVLREYPRGRYALDARGWLARLALDEGDRATALAEYYRLLSVATDPRTKGSLLVSLRLTRHHADAEDMRRVEAELADEPAAALIYAYHNIYNYAPSAGFYLLDCKDEFVKTDEEDRQEFSRQTERQELARIGAFTTRLLQRYPHTALSGGFALRLAQAQLELGEHKAALQSATRALQLGAKDRERVEALWVKGASEWRLRDYAASRRTLKQLIAEFPRSDLAEGAGRIVAMAAEDAGDLDGALEQYIALNYEDDFAYFVDVLMTPEQLAGFIARHSNSPRLNDLNYALAVRYLRVNRWAEARAALGKVKVTEERYAGTFYSFESSGDGQRHFFKQSDDPIEFRSKGTTAKMPSEARGVAARWLWRDMKTVEDLERLENTAAAAQGDEAKAEALYQLASYLYQGSSLLFYNPGLWGGVRHYKLEDLESNNGYRAPGEAQLLYRSAQEHEPVAHALKIYLDIVTRFPNTQAARDALYTAAVCHERLSGYNMHWRNAYELGLHAGERMVTYGDVETEYPNYQLPRGTIGWEPATRTVNGGPGWNEAPKPKPRPTVRAKIKQRITGLFAETRRGLRQLNTRTAKFRESVAAGILYSVLAVTLLALCYCAITWLYVRRRPLPDIALREGKGIATTAREGITSSTDSRVEKIINDSQPGPS